MSSVADWLDGFRVFSEYECGRAQMAIEWVARAQKPIVEIGGRLVAGADVAAIAADLDRCIALSGATVRGFIVPDKTAGSLCYGFYRFPWALAALIHVWGIEQATARDGRLLWEQGLVFGYSADAIASFIESACASPESRSRRRPCSSLSRRSKVEIYGSLAPLARRCSSPNDRCQKQG